MEIKDYKDKKDITIVAADIKHPFLFATAMLSCVTIIIFIMTFYYFNPAYNENINAAGIAFFSVVDLIVIAADVMEIINVIKHKYVLLGSDVSGQFHIYQRVNRKNTK